MTTIPEKSTNQLAVWRELLDALDRFDDTWRRAQVTGADTQLPANVTAALAKAAGRATDAIAGVAEVLADQLDSGAAFRRSGRALRQAAHEWPGNR